MKVMIELSMDFDNPPDNGGDPVLTYSLPEPWYTRYLEAVNKGTTRGVNETREEDIFLAGISLLALSVGELFDDTYINVQRLEINSELT